MAGIGFALRKLTNQDNLIGFFYAYSHAAVAACGPWLFTMVALGSVYPFMSDPEMIAKSANFHIIVAYNFGFSLILSAPLCIVTTRYLADGVYSRNVTHTPTVMLVSLCLLYLILLPLAIYYYGYYTELTLSMRLCAIANLFLVSMIWVLSVYMTALKNYTAVTAAFAIGMTLAIGCSRLLGDRFGDETTMIAFNIGMSWIAFSLAGKVFSEYPYQLVRNVRLKKYFIRYWDLALGALFYNTAIWIDKIVMWTMAPEAEILPNKMLHYSLYDGATFLAYLTIVPAMAIFVFSIETNFYIQFQRFYQDIKDHKSLAGVRANHKRVIECLIGNAGNFFVIQGTITLVSILMAAKIFGLLHINYLEIGIFRLTTLGAFFHVLAMFAMILLQYFDSRRVTMYIQGLFMVSNGVFTWCSIQAGFPYYGYGYFMASLVTFSVAFIILCRHLKKLPYHAFVTNNASTKLAAVDQGL